MDDWKGGESGITYASARLSSLRLRYGWLHHGSALDRYATVSVAVQNIGGEFFHVMGRVRGIATISSLILSEDKTNPRLGTSVVFIPMR